MDIESVSNKRKSVKLSNAELATALAHIKANEFSLIEKRSNFVSVLKVTLADYGVIAVTYDKQKKLITNTTTYIDEYVLVPETPVKITKLLKKFIK